MKTGKKPLAVLLTLLCVLVFVGCSRSSENDGQTVPAESGDLSGVLVRVTSNGETIEPHPHFAYSCRLARGGMVEADGAPLQPAKLSELEADGSIPHLTYADDYSVTFGSSVEFRNMALYDENFEPLELLYKTTDPPELEAGDYYVGILVVEYGDYIEEWDTTEYTGWECVFRLTVE